MLINSGLRDVIDGGELLYFGEEYAGEYIDNPEEELERMRQSAERRKRAKKGSAKNV